LQDITIVGDINLDMILYGLEQHLPLEREILASDFRMTLGGSSAILAHNLAALGTPTAFIGKIQDDDLGRLALARLRHAGVDTSRCLRVSDATPTGVTVLLHHGAQRRILTYPGTIAELEVSDLDQAYLLNAKHFHISSFFLQKKLQPNLPELCTSLRLQGIKVSLDTNDDPDDAWGAAFRAMLPAIDTLLPNRDEARRMAGTEDLSEAVTWLGKRVPLVVVKCGADGALVQKGDRRWEIPAYQTKPVDTIGAGDSFNAGFLSCLLRGLSVEQCAQGGNTAAALSTLRSGGTEAFCEPSLLNQLLNEPPFAHKAP
jgi:sugar/nucleoside kinase (ribokinase family)